MALFGSSPAPLGHNRPPIDVVINGEMNEVVAPQVTELSNAAATLNSDAQRTIVSDAATASQALNIIAHITAVTKSAEDARTQAKRPYLEAGRQVDGLFAPISKALADAKDMLQRKWNDWHFAEQARIAKERQEAEAEARRLQQQAEFARSKGERQQLEQNARDVQAQAATIQAPQVAVPEGVRARTTQTVRFEVVDESKLTREYLAPDLDKIKAESAKAKKLGRLSTEKKEIVPGVMAWIEEKISAF